MPSIFIILHVFTAACILPTHAAVLRVSPGVSQTPPPPYSSLTMSVALQLARDGDVLLLQPGTYACPESGVGYVVANSSISIVAAPPSDSSSAGGTGYRVVFDCKGRGRALWFRECPFVNVSGISFHNGWAKQTGSFQPSLYGGSVRLEYGVHPLLSGSTSSYNVHFSGCAFHNTSSGSALWIQNEGSVNGTKVTFENCQFTHNRGRDGGSISLFYRSAAHFVATRFLHCSFLDNTAGFGGAIFINLDALAPKFSVAFIRCSLARSSATDSGGAVYARFLATASAHISFHGCDFSNNTAHLRGGAIRVANDRQSTYTAVDVEGFPSGSFTPPCEFCWQVREWHATTVVTVQIVNSTFVSNSAVSPSGPAGGAVSLSNTFLNMTGCSLSANSAPQGMGGALSLEGTAELRLAYSVLRSNHASQGGGSLYMHTEGVTYISGVQITLGAADDAAGSGVLGQWRIDQTGGPLRVDNSSVWTCLPGHTMVAPPVVPFSTPTAPDATWLASQRIECVRCAAPTYALQAARRWGPVHRLGAQTHDGTAASSSTVQEQVHCQACVFGGDCSLGGDLVRGHAGMWGVAVADGRETGLAFTHCPFGYCADALHPWDQSCAMGRVGRLCGSCLPGHAQLWGSAPCIPDNECASAAWFFPAALLLASCYVVYFCVAPLVSSGLTIVLVYFYQIANLLMQRNRVHFNTLLGVFHMRVQGSSSMNVCPIPGLSTETAVALGFVSPLLMLLLLALVWLLLRRASLLQWCAQRWPTTGGLMSGDLQHAWARLGIFTFSAVSSTTFQLLHCVPVRGLDGARRFLFVAASTECYQPWQGFLFVLAVLLALAPVATFVYVLRATPTHSHKQGPRSRSESGGGWADSDCVSLGGHVPDDGGSTAVLVLTSPFKAHSRWWLAVLLAELVLLALVHDFVTDPTEQAIAMCAVTMCSALVHALRKPFRVAQVDALQLCTKAVAVMLSVLTCVDAMVVTLAASASQRQQAPNTLTAQAVLMWMPLLLAAVVLVFMNWKSARSAEPQLRPNIDGSSTLHAPLIEMTEDS